MTDRAGYERMRSGQPYEAPDFYLLGLQAEARRKLDVFNAMSLDQFAERAAQLQAMLGRVGEGMVMSPVIWEYGTHIHLGEGVFINFECVFLDGADIVIGDGTAIAPRVQFLTAGHPVEPHKRARFHPETGKRNGAWCVNKPITVGKDCWIGAGTIIVGGVTIGDGTTIGAGSVVTRDIPAGVVAAGNPCRVIRHLRAGERASTGTLQAANAA